MCRHPRENPAAGLAGRTQKKSRHGDHARTGNSGFPVREVRQRSDAYLTFLMYFFGSASNLALQLSQQKVTSFSTFTVLAGSLSLLE